MELFDLSKWPYRLPEKSIVFSIHVDTEPLAKCRPKFNGKSGHAYTPKSTKDYETFLKWQFKLKKEKPNLNRNDAFGVRIIFYRTNNQRIDIDNMVKAIFDSANGIIWNDDSQVRELTAKLIKNSENPGIDVLFYITPDDSGVKKCPQCGKKYRRPPSTSGTFCSMECYNKSKQVQVTCKQCQKVFTLSRCLAKKRHNFCSHSCSAKWWWNYSPKAPVRQSKCLDCGKQVSRREYKYCRHCAFVRRYQHPNSAEKTSLPSRSEPPEPQI